MLNFYRSLSSRDKILTWVVLASLLVALIGVLSGTPLSADIPTVVSASAAVASAVVAFHAVQVQNRNARVTLNIQLMQHLREEYSSESMKRHRKNAALILLEELSPSVYEAREWQETFIVFNFFERMGALVARGELDELFVYLEFQFPLYAYWHKSKPLVEYGRNVLRDPAVLVNMEDLYKRVLAQDIEESKQHGGMSVRGSFDETRWESWATDYLKSVEATL